MPISLTKAFLLFAIVAHSLTANAQDGILDPTFGNAGRVITDFGAFDVSFGVAVQPDGKILVCGATTTTTPQNAIVVRYLTNGALDTTFGNGGKTGISVGSAGSSAYALALQIDGKVLITGKTADTSNTGVSDIFLARFNPNGSVDDSFGTAGATRIINSGWNEAGLAIGVQSRGEIIVAGNQDDNNNTHLVVLRFDTAGDLDASFGVNGKFVYHEAYSGTGLSFAQNDDFIVLGQSPGDETTTVIYLHEDGSPHTGFGNNGIATLDLIPGNDKAERVFSSFINADSSITIGGNFDGFGAARLTATGVPDTSFGINGVCHAKFPGNQYALTQGGSCVVQPDAKILVTGLLIDAMNDDFGIARFDKTGHLDTLFGDGGWVSTDMTGTQDWCYASVLQADNKLVLSGYSLGNQKIDILLARYTLEIDSILPPTGSSQIVDIKPRIFPNPTSGIFTLEYTLSGPAKTALELFDVSGNLVRNLFLGHEDDAGNKAKFVDLAEVANGFYILRLKAGADRFFFPIIKQE